jgi:Flp pilus assembly protein TadD
VRRASCPRTNDVDATERAEELTARAHRLRRKGELRRASIAYREACGLDEQNAARWTWLGDTLARMGKRDEAERAMMQSLFLRQRAGEKAKANVVRGLLLQLGRAGIGDGASKSKDARRARHGRRDFLRREMQSE